MELAGEQPQDRGGSISLARRLHSLSQNLVGRDGHAVREVQAADLRADWNLESSLRGCFQQRLRKALRFAAENKDIAPLESRLGVKSSGRFREEPRLARRQSRDDGRPIIDGLPFQALPIVEAGPAEIVIVHAKA